MTNPFSRKRRDPLGQALGAIDEIRSEAAERAAGIRDAAAQAAELLGDAAPEARRHRVPIALGILAAGVGIAIALRGRRGEPALPEAPPVSQTPADAAAKQAAAPKPPEPGPAAGGGKPEPETPKEPRAETAESEAAAGGDNR